jgi:DNA-binding IclR family transcriptional regulator
MNENNSGQVTRRIFSILEAFTIEEPALSALELSRRLELPRSTVHRLLATLLEEGYIDQDPDTLKYHLGLKLLRLSHIVMNQLKLEQTAYPLMQQLASQTNANTYLGVLDQKEGVILYLTAVSSLLPITVVGVRAPIHSTALGKAVSAYLSERWLEKILSVAGMEAITPRTITNRAQLKAHLAEVRRRGYAIDEEESLPGMCCLAAPVQHHAGNVVSAVSVSAPTYIFTQERRPEIARMVCACANAISRALGCPENLLISYSGDLPSRTLSVGREEVTSG